MLNPPSVALVGCGHWGRNLARNLARLGALTIVSDADPVLLEGVRTLYPGVRVTPDATAAVHDPTVDACVIATPPVTHFDLARQAIEAGKDVFVEKPLALTVRDGEALVALAEQHGRILMVGHILEYHPAIEKL